MQRLRVVKNPYLSAWLSMANAVAGPARAQALQQGRRHQRLLVEETARAVTACWSAALSVPTRRTRRSR